MTTRTADLTVSKIPWNSVLSTDDATYATLDIANFYLGTPLDRYEYMKMPLSIFPQHVKDQYNLDNMAYQGYVWLETRAAIYGLPQAEILANKLLREKLHSNVTHPVQFLLVMDDFSVKYVGEENAEHLINAIQSEGCKLFIGWSGDKYCGKRFSGIKICEP